MTSAKRVALIVDDDPLLRRSVRRLLPDFDVVEAATVDEGFAAVQEHTPAVILCDVDLETKSSGLDLVRRLQETNPELISRLALVSGGTTAKQVGVPLARLDKPFTANELRALVDRLSPPG